MCDLDVSHNIHWKLLSVTGDPDEPKDSDNDEADKRIQMDVSKDGQRLSDSVDESGKI